MSKLRYAAYYEGEMSGEYVKMSRLRELPNIGKELDKLLVQVGLDTPEKLRIAGVHEAFIRLKMSDPAACHSKLYAIDGAIKGIRWHYLSPEEKHELNNFYKSL